MTNEEPTERFADEETKAIPPMDTWENLTVNQMIDVKSELQDKAWQCRRTPSIVSVLNRSIGIITKMINERSAKF